jgi:hypothetical protein
MAYIQKNDLPSAESAVTTTLRLDTLLDLEDDNL